MKWFARSLVLFFWMFAAAVTGRAQDGVITGRVSDSSQAFVPGVSITLTGAQVMGERTLISDERGAYRFTLLPPGVYSVKFELPGFKTLIREGIQMSAGFTATINATMDVADVADTVTVSGESPVVDLESATVGTSFNAAVYSALSEAHNWGSLLGVMPGVQVLVPDVGGSGVNQFTAPKAFGTIGQLWMLVDGVISNQGSSGAGGLYYDTDMFSELQVTAATKSAEVPVSGIVVNYILKSGGNDIHGLMSSDWINKKFEGSNIDDKLRSQGITAANSRQRWNDFHGNVGGPFIKDKFWWFGELGDQYTGLYLLGYKYDDGTLQVFDTYLPRAAVKFNYQVTPKNMLTYSGLGTEKIQPHRISESNGPLVHPEAAINSLLKSNAQKVQLTTALSPRMTLETKLARYGFLLQYQARIDAISRKDLDTLQSRGGYAGEAGNASSLPNVNRQPRYHIDTVLAVNRPGFGGTHNIRTGYGWLLDFGNQQYWPTKDNIVTYWRGGFKTPAFIEVYDAPVWNYNRMRQQWLFANDTWNVTRRLTLNVGIRYDRYVNYLPAQGTPGIAPISLPFSIPKTVYPAMNGTVPRISAVYNIFGNGRTAIKASYGGYENNPSTAIIAGINPVNTTKKKYIWDGTLPYIPDPTKLVSTTGGSTAKLDPNLQLPHVDEYTAGIDQQIMKDMSASFTFVRKFEENGYVNFNSAIPYSAYTIPVTFTDPGRDNISGTADDQKITVYGVDPAFRGLNRPLERNSSAVAGMYTNYSLEVTKRMSNKWQLLTGIDFLRFHIDQGEPSDPNLQVNNDQKYWHWQYKAIGSYDLPRGFNIAPSYRLIKGEPYGRTLNTPSLNQGVVTILAEPVGAYFLPTYGILDVRVEKKFKLSERSRLTAIFDLFNLTNTNAALGVISVTGPKFGYASQTIVPRVFRLGGRYDF